jgi:ubiquinone/menaquinone biosynthesis C-methylase UbiE
MTISTGKYSCPNCKNDCFNISSTRWDCLSCGQHYACVRGIPRLYIETSIGEQDRKLRDHFYNGLFGRIYAFLMPFIVLPVRPAKTAWRHWTLYGVIVAALLALLWGLLGAIAQHINALIASIYAIILVAITFFFASQRYLFNLFILAIPTRLSIVRSKFTPDETFSQVHERVLAQLLARTDKLQILDVSTGSCNSLYKHGWMKLNADYTALDLSDTMLSNGLELMSSRGIAVDLILGDAMNLPFQAEKFDVVLNYGAINGMTNPGKALDEMVRVARPGALLLFLDEQMYTDATKVERSYFHKVLSNHNVIHHCPIELLSPDLEDVKVSQVYEFYYICTARKKIPFG